MNELTPEDAKASLGLATRLSEQFLMQEAQQMAQAQGMGQEAPQEGQMPPTEAQPQEMPQTPQTGLEPVLEEIRAGFAELKEAMKSDESKEVDSLKKELQKIIDEDE